MLLSVVIAALTAGVLLGVLFRLGYDRSRANGLVRAAQEQSKRLLELAEREAGARKKEIEFEARDRLFQERQEFESMASRQREEFNESQSRLGSLERELTQTSRALEESERGLEARRSEVTARATAMVRKEAELDKLMADERGRLERVAGLTAEEARAQLLRGMEKEARRDSADMLKRMEDETRELADRQARQVIGLAIGRWASSHTAETTVSVVHIPSEDMKGRIIGREGRNIRALENATGVDLIIDDTPETVVLSSFNAFRREIARISLEQLLHDGRIHPSRIEEVVQKTRDEMEGQLAIIGDQACVEAGVGRLHPEINRLMGKLKYRTSFGQNILLHSLEVAHLAGTMAAELGANADVARRAGFLHDIGKALDQDREGTHTQLGVEVLKRYGEHPAVLHCVEAHHNDVPMESVEACLVQAADAISASRPGARRESVEAYIKRLQKLEEIAHSFTGVTQAYALQAGREVRIMVAHDLVSDALAAQLARDVARKVEAELDYPGQIKVQVIRETRAVEYAK